MKSGEERKLQQGLGLGGQMTTSSLPRKKRENYSPNEALRREKGGANGTRTGIERRRE